MIKVYTDGSITYNPGGDAGWGAVIFPVEYREYKEYVYGHEPNSTNNRAEINAVLWSLKYLYSMGITDRIYVYSDSQYVVNCINRYLPKWVRKNTIDVMANDDLWIQFPPLLDALNVEVRWIRSHNGNKYNDLADQVANLARLQKNDEIEQLKREY